MPSGAARDEIKRLRTESKRLKMERALLKKVVTIFFQPPPSRAAINSFAPAWCPGPCKCSATCCASAAPAITSGRAAPSPSLPRCRWRRKPPSRATRRYGTRHLREGLRAEGYSVGRYALRS